MTKNKRFENLKEKVFIQTLQEGDLKEHKCGCKFNNLSGICIDMCLPHQNTYSWYFVNEIEQSFFTLKRRWTGSTLGRDDIDEMLVMFEGFKKPRIL